MRKKDRLGHLMAIICVTIWGSSFVVSKGLMEFLNPVQLILLRFTLAYALLWVLYPKWYFRWKEEWRFLAMAVFANTLYYWAENTALTLTQTSNVSILVSTSPIITALILTVFRKEENLTRKQGFGFAIAFGGVVLVVLNGAFMLQVSPAGDLLALVAAASWAVYGLLLRRWTDTYDSLLLTRKLMFYGIVTVLPLVLLDSQPIDWEKLLTISSMVKLMYLAFVCGAVCYLLWSGAVKRIGILQSNLYINMVPLVTLIVSALVLNETVTAMGVAGILQVIVGMIFGTI